MDWFLKSVRLAYFPSKDNPLMEKWVRLRSVAESMGLSESAKKKLEWIIFYHTVARGNAKATAKYFAITRKTLHKWLGRFSETNLRLLEEESRAPVKRRVWAVTSLEEERIVNLRKDCKCKWGKEKLRRRYRKEYNLDISTSKIQKVINKYYLYPDVKEHDLRLKRRRKRKARLLITNFEKKPFMGYLWHTDSIIIWWYGVRRVIFTAVEDITKIAYARVYSSSSSDCAKDFLQRLVYLSNSQITNVHHDNGSEFEKEFEKACQALGITQIYSRVRTPKDNPALERFNWTIQDEWLSVSEVGLDDLVEANTDLTAWLTTYNSIRPHESLDYLTPLEYATQRFKVSPMWASSTRICEMGVMVVIYPPIDIKGR